jgi:hypothetical protein
VEEGAERRPAAGAGVVNGKHAKTHAWTSCGTYTSTMATYASPLFGPTSSGDQPLMPPGTQFVIAGRGGYTGQVRQATCTSIRLEQRVMTLVSLTVTG